MIPILAGVSVTAAVVFLYLAILAAFQAGHSHKQLRAAEASLSLGFSEQEIWANHFKRERGILFNRVWQFLSPAAVFALSFLVLVL